MQTFDYQRAKSLEHALTLAQQLASSDPSQTPKNPANTQVIGDNKNNGVFFIAGGTNLLDLMKHEIETPHTLIDISRLPLNDIELLPNGGLKIGALVSNSELAAHPIIRKEYAVLARALLAGASGQLRNKASTGGNLLQRTRCYYFYQPDSPCNKRLPNSGCPAKVGEHRNLAILGTSEQCIANHPSDMAVAMRLLDAQIVVEKHAVSESDSNAKPTNRHIPIQDFYRLPDNTPHLETNLQAGEIITHIILPPPVHGVHSYDKVRDRASYAFALVSVAAVIAVSDGKLSTVNLAFGGIGSVPWRDSEVEQALLGTTGDTVSIELAVALLLKHAKTDEQTDYKAVLVQRLLHHVIARALENSQSAQTVSPSIVSPLSSGVSL